MWEGGCSGPRAGVWTRRRTLKEGLAARTGAALSTQPHFQGGLLDVGMQWGQDLGQDEVDHQAR